MLPIKKKFKICAENVWLSKPVNSWIILTINNDIVCIYFRLAVMLQKR